MWLDNDVRARSMPGKSACRIARAVVWYHLRMSDQQAVRSIVQDFLEGHMKMVLSVNEAGGPPNTVLMHYAIDKSLHLHFGTKRSSAKYAALTKDPRVSFLVIEEGLDPTRVASGRGEVRELEGESGENAKLLFKSINKSKWYMEEAKDLVMFQIKPTSLCWLDGSSGELKICDIAL